MPIWLPTLALLAALQTSPTKPDPELEKHQGVWKVLGFVREGNDTPKDLLTEMERVVEGDHVVWRRQGKNFAGTTMILDPKADPKTIDLIPDGGRSRGKVVKGIYRWDGDRFVLCNGDPDAPRPTEFSAPKGSRRTLMTFEKRPAQPAHSRKPGLSPADPKR